jgi:plastocyanin
VKRSVTAPIVVALLLLGAPTVAHAAPALGAGHDARPARDISRVKIVSFRFRPGTLTISRGDVVRWTNHADIAHTTTSSTWDSGRLEPGESFRKRFRHRGTFSYHCSIHPQMTGRIVVR